MARLDRFDVKMWAAVFGTALAVVAGAYLLAYQLAPPAHDFSGMLYDSPDGYTYWAWAEAFKRGGLLVDNPYSTIPVKPQYFNLVWFVLGKTMKYTGIPYIPLSYLFGIVFGGAMYMAILAFMREITDDRASAWFAFLLAGLGSGFGWIIALIWPYFSVQIFPSDLFCADGFPFFSLLSFPHLTFSFFLLTMIYLWMYRATIHGRRKLSLGAGLLILILGFSHPYHIVSILAILGTWYLALTVKHGKKCLPCWIDYAILVACSLPSVIYFRFLFNTNPNFSSWSAQNIVTSRGLPSVLVGLGLFLILAIPGVWAILSHRSPEDRHLLVILWLAVNFALLFSYPYINFGGRLIQGLILPLAILSSWGFFKMLLPRFGRAPKTDAGQTDTRAQFTESSGERIDLRFLWAIPILLLTLPSHAIIIANQLSGPIKGKFPFEITVNTRMYITKVERQALDFAARNLGGSTILSSHTVGLILPVFANVRSFIGHVGITPAQRMKSKMLMRFYDSNYADADRFTSLKTWNIDYIWKSPSESSIGRYDPSLSTFLKKVFDNGLISIYKID